ncbi:MAG: excinuclease ABC subunit UvrC [Candidatus Marinimicrobia bacterium]|nr:excinuclease ABC subunit UvrC [Candidatus Neomarinimicrobiota bacterium]HJM34576.1 excinuclease ABC subunit UvrC [Candidatus Neomarinimicrobiota bacterium]
MSLQSQLKNIPTSPGVYRFTNENEEIIYIGKAKNLRSRVRSYFQKGKSQSPKNLTMVRHIRGLEWIVVRSEVEALLTEANLIKQHSPRYNVMMKDDKSFPFIRITHEPFPQVLLTRKVVKDGSSYFGPFTDVHRLRTTLKALHKVFPIRSCSFYLDKQVITEKKVKLCLDYHIRKCEGPCEGLVSREHYQSMIDRIKQFMRGKTKEMTDYIMGQMRRSSAQMHYEEAAMYRDQLQAIRSFTKRQSQVAVDFADRDVIALARKSDIGIAVVIRIRNGRIFSREKIPLKGLDNQDADTMKSVITRFYMDSDLIPREISLPNSPTDEKELLTWLKGRRGGTVRFLFPQRGEKVKELRITAQNAKLLLGEWIITRKKRKEQVPKMLTQLQEDLNLETPPRRIEAFDISHLGGTNTVASMVSFIDTRPRKKEYRKFNVKTVSGIDDFAAMREVVFRRYKRAKEEQGSLPDLVLIDGGKGQLSMAVSALRELGLDYIPIVGLAKKLEEVFMPGNPDAQTIHKQSPGLILLRRIRDEAHRFAITFQRQKRNKQMVHSMFGEIPGVGKKRLEKLLQAFDGPAAITQLTPEVINGETGIPVKIAKEIIKVAKSI